jgi:hypothetical protein
MPGELSSMLIKDFTAFPLGNFLVHAMKAFRGREDITPLIRHLGSRENPWYQLNRKLDGPQSQVWTFGEKSHFCWETNSGLFDP